MPPGSSSTTSQPSCTWATCGVPGGRHGRPGGLSEVGPSRATCYVPAAPHDGETAARRGSQGEADGVPEDLRYTKEHEWARDEGSSRVRVGITDFAQDALGDVVYVDVPQEGATVTANQPFSEVESTKSVSDVYAPVSGTVAERNALLEERPELVNEQPYGDGWLVVIEVADAGPLEGLMDAGAYRAFVEQQTD